MGNTANSTELLQVPIQRACSPFRLSKHDVVVEKLTRYRIEPPGGGNVHTQVYDADTDERKHELARAVLTYRIELLVPDGRVVMSVDEKSFEGYYRVYEGVEREKESFTVRVRGAHDAALLWIQFKDRISGDVVRVFTEGDCNDSVALFYMERHAAELPPMVKKGNSARATCKMIGRVRRPELSNHEYLVGTAGVDMTLLLMLWTVRHDIQERNGPMGSVEPITKRIGLAAVVGGGECE